VNRVFALTASVLALSATAAAGGASGAQESTAKGRAALARAEALLTGASAGGGNATIALRDLALATNQLSAGDRRRADSLLARPSSTAADPRTGYAAPETYTCSEHFCVHYVTSTVDAPPLHDSNGNNVPDWVETNISVLEFLWQQEVVEYGFRPPKSDANLPNHGPDGRFDVYLADIVDRSILGYCAPERPVGYGYFDASGYCVLDNDYSAAQIGPPGLAGILELELTAVHEFFHAIQFGYDASDDTWLLEGTATWIEDEVYGNVHEAYNRFPYSPLRQPHIPIDTYDSTRPYQYGSWVFWRFLEELMAPAPSQVDPTVIRRIWEHADGRPGAEDAYSLQAVQETLAEHGITFRSAFLTFAVANFVPRSFYRDGALWPSAPVDRALTLGGKSRLAAGKPALDHLTSRYFAFRPARGVGTQARLSFELKLPPILRGSAAAVILFPRSGQPSTQPVPLSLAGGGSLTVPFGPGRIARVVLVLVNASDRFRCGFRRSRYSCAGTPLDDDVVFRYSARLRG
jgi:hypothetical protein